MMEKVLNEDRTAELWAAVKAYVDARPGGDVNPSYLVKAPVGTIVIWSGTAENVPNGWALCDGQDGRPDLRDKFVLGSGDNHPVGETGGSEEVTLTVGQMPAHTHLNQVQPVNAIPGQFTGAVFRDTAIVSLNNSSLQAAANVTYIGGNQPHSNMPPYYALCYIIKIALDETDGGTAFTTDDTLTMSAENVLSVATPVKRVLTQAEFDALPEDEQKKGLYIIPGGEDGSSGGSPAGEVYSTEETRIGTWIDGKPLYQKTYTPNKGISANVSASYELCDIADLNVDTVIDISGMFTYEGIDMPIRAIGNQTTNIGCNAEKTQIRLQNAYGTANILIVTIKYTKTTD